MTQLQTAGYKELHNTAWCMALISQMIIIELELDGRCSRAFNRHTQVQIHFSKKKGNLTEPVALVPASLFLSAFEES